ncbi:hypothetical protein KBT16_14840 [Nostoc sp. CCCryo 231-06]|nr:hypothetical protein [Nostoc sp. CCCryo 231-06]
MSVKTHLPWRIEFARQLLMGETPRRSLRDARSERGLAIAFGVSPSPKGRG